MARKAKRIKTGNSMYNLDGFEEVRELLQSLQDRAPELVDQELETAARNIEADAKGYIKSKSGHLASSIKVQKSKARYKIIAGGASAPHAHLVEFGHRMVNENGQVIGDVPPHPFLRRAFEKNKAKMIASITKAIGRLV